MGAKFIYKQKFVNIIFQILQYFNIFQILQYFNIFPALFSITGLVFSRGYAWLNWIK